MSTLHLLRTSGFSSPDLQDCIYNLSKHDDLVLIDDGCYNINHASIGQALSILNHPIKVIREHADARGIALNNQYMAIEISDIVDMTFLHHNSVTWQ